MNISSRLACDSSDGLLLLFGMKRASRKPDLEHPYGYSHELYFWTLVVAVMIFALGGGFSIYEGYHNICEIGPDTQLGNPLMSYIVIAVSVVIEGISLSVALKNFNKARGNKSPFKFIREAKERIGAVTVSIVGGYQSPEDEEKCRLIAEELGVRFRVR